MAHWTYIFYLRFPLAFGQVACKPISYMSQIHVETVVLSRWRAPLYQELFSGPGTAHQTISHTIWIVHQQVAQRRWTSMSISDISILFLTALSCCLSVYSAQDERPINDHLPTSLLYASATSAISGRFRQHHGWMTS